MFLIPGPYQQASRTVQCKPEITLGKLGQEFPYLVMPMQTAAFDVIGIFGFSKDFRATLDLQGEGAQACKCLSDGEN